MLDYIEYGLASGDCNPITMNSWDDDIYEVADKIATKLHNGHSFTYDEVKYILDDYGLANFTVYVWAAMADIAENHNRYGTTLGSDRNILMQTIEKYSR